MLFKQEWTGFAIVALSSKTYFGLGEKNKRVSKGISIKQNQFTHQQYLDVLKTQKRRSGTNTTFRSTDNEIRTLAQQRCGLTYFYPKHIVLNDGVSTAPLLLWFMHVCIPIWRNRRKSAAGRLLSWTHCYWWWCINCSFDSCTCADLSQYRNTGMSLFFCFFLFR